MTYQEDIDTLNQQIEAAERRRDASRAAGMQESYEAAYLLVESLQLRRNEQLRQPVGEHGRA